MRFCGLYYVLYIWRSRS